MNDQTLVLHDGMPVLGVLESSGDVTERYRRLVLKRQDVPGGEWQLMYDPAGGVFLHSGPQEVLFKLYKGFFGQYLIMSQSVVNPRLEPFIEGGMIVVQSYGRRLTSLLEMEGFAAMEKYFILIGDAYVRLYPHLCVTDIAIHNAVIAPSGNIAYVADFKTLLSYADAKTLFPDQYVYRTYVFDMLVWSWMKFTASPAMSSVRVVLLRDYGVSITELPDFHSSLEQNPDCARSRLPLEALATMLPTGTHKAPLREPYTDAQLQRIENNANKHRSHKDSLRVRIMRLAPEIVRIMVYHPNTVVTGMATSGDKGVLRTQ